MIVKSIKLKNYGKFNEFELSFKEDLNIIYGQNEAGKSTIKSALIDGLCGFDSKFSKHNYSNGDKLSVFIELKDSTIFRELDKYNSKSIFEPENLKDNYLQKRNEFVKYNLIDSSVLKEVSKKSINKLLSSLEIQNETDFKISELIDNIRIENGSLFKKRGVQKLNKLILSRDEITQKINNIVLEQERNWQIYRENEKLKESLLELEDLIINNVDKLSSLNIKKEQGILISKLRTHYLGWKFINETKEYDISSEYISIKKNIKIFDDLISDIEKRIKLQEFDLILPNEKEFFLSQLVNILDVLIEIDRKINIQTEDKIKKLNYLNNMKADIGNITASYFRYKTFEDILLLENFKMSNIIIVLNLFLAVFFLVLYFSINNIFLGAINIFILFGFFTVKRMMLDKAFEKSGIGLKNYSIIKLKKILNNIFDKIKEYKREEQNLKIIENEITEFKNQISNFGLEQSEINKIENSYIKVNAFNKAKNQISLSKVQLEEYIVKQKNLIDEKLNYEKLLQKISPNVDEAIELYNKYKTDYIEYNNITVLNPNINIELLTENIDLEQIEEQIHSIKEKIKVSQLKKEEETIKYANNEGFLSSIDLNDVSQLKLELNIIKRDIDELSYKYLINQASIQILQKANEKYINENQPLVIKKASEYLNYITDGNYVKIILNEEKSPVLVNKDNEYIELSDNLSTGTLDQVALCIIMGILNSKYTLEKFPLMLDDSFVNFDDNRYERILKVLEKLSIERQIFYFTCHKRVLKDKGIDYFEVKDEIC
jgi:hypothetical protein